MCVKKIMYQTMNKLFSATLSLVMNCISVFSWSRLLHLLFLAFLQPPSLYNVLSERAAVFSQSLVALLQLVLIGNHRCNHFCCSAHRCAHLCCPAPGLQLNGTTTRHFTIWMVCTEVHSPSLSPFIAHFHTLCQKMKSDNVGLVSSFVSWTHLCTFSYSRDLCQWYKNFHNSRFLVHW